MVLFDKGACATPETVHKLIKEGSIEVLTGLRRTFRNAGRF